MNPIISKILIKAIKESTPSLRISEQEIEKTIEIPPSTEMGDYAFPCFFLAEKLKQNPIQIALNLKGKIKKLPNEFSLIETKGPYINFFLNRENLAGNLIQQILKEQDNFGKTKLKKQKKIMVEFPSPNTNKPLHLGHLKNMSIGESVSRILEFSGEKIIRANLNNDRGIHICSSMLAYEKWGKGKKPSKRTKPDKLVGDFYVLFMQKAKQDPTLEEQAHEMLRKWEAGDKKISMLAKKMNKWTLDGQKQTYRKFGIKHDKEYFESRIYEKGRKLVLDGVKKGIFHKQEDGSVRVNLEEGEKYLLRPDGTSLYITQDLYLAKIKADEFKLDSSIYVTGQEQDYHFKILFELLKKLKFGFADKIYHLSYGMVNLPEGKMKSREGTVVDADDVIDNVQNLVKKELEKREKLSKKELEKRSLIIALAAIKYLLLKVDIKKTVVFNPKESMKFEGNTGPYLQYSYARASSILKKAKNRKKNFNIEKLEQKEIDLIKKLSEFKETVSESCKNLNPSLIANYAYQLASIFNEFYHTCPVVGSENENFRLSLVETFRQILKSSLYLLGIEVLEKM